MVGFDDWIGDQEVRYELRATVNGEVAANISDYDPEVLFSQVGNMEKEVAQLLNDQYTDMVTDQVDVLADIERGK